MADAPKSDGAAAKPDVPAAKTDDKSPAVPAPAAPAPAKSSVPPQHPDEPAFHLKLSPDQFIEFKSDNLLKGPVCADVSLTNPTKVRQVYKIKCTSNEIFRVRPPVAFIKPDETVSIKFTLSTKTVPDITKHFFAFYHMSAPETTEKTVAKQMWTATSKPEGIKRIPIKVLKDNGTPWTVDAPLAADAAAAPPATAAAPPTTAAAPPLADKK